MKLVVASCALVIAVLPATAVAQFTDWSAPVKVTGINTPDWSTSTLKFNSCVSISKDGLSLFYSSNRLRGTNDFPDVRDLFVSQRDTVDDPWGEGVPLTTLNTSAWLSCPALSPDEHRLFFANWQAPGCGGKQGGDIVVSRRHSREDDFGWDPPVQLGCDPQGPNSANGGGMMAGFDGMPALFEDEAGREIMYFASTRSGAFHIYQSEMDAEGTFGPATPVAKLNGGLADQGPTVRRDGLEVIFLSVRPTPYGLSPSFNFWTATRNSTAEPWSEPTFVSSLGYPAMAQGKISLSFDGRELYFTSSRDGRTDLWVARREKQQDKKK